MKFTSKSLMLRDYAVTRAVLHHDTCNVSNIRCNVAVVVLVLFRATCACCNKNVA